jgi:tRNA modification GTPase
VGKSSLLNALLGEERAIVTPIPGTTRDVIAESINLDGLPVVLWDTAGVRDSENEVEQLGVERTRRHLAESDAVLLVLDGSVSLTKDDLQIIREVQGKKHLTVINKADLPLQLVIEEIDGLGSLSEANLVSATFGSGIASLKLALRELLLNSRVEPSVAVTNVRHRSELSRSSDALIKAMVTISDNFAPELVAVDLNQAREALEEIIGLVNNDDILERIFINFCIGK